jgi:outer membrane protein OmpA-like peptidoglycan-associated protein
MTFWQDDIDRELAEEQDSGVWLSVGDLMSGLLMFFALLFIAVSAQLLNYQELIKDLPQKILTAVQDKVGEKGSFSIDAQTGDISLEDKILFDEGQAVLNLQGQKFLSEFIPLYSEIIFSNPEYEKQVIRIIIEGHTSSKGEEKANLELSFKRALAVNEYISTLDFPTKEKFTKKLLAGGRGEIDAKQYFDDPKDRKVMFRFQFKREDLQHIFNP